MVKLFLVTGWNSWNEKQLTRVFRQPSNAEAFANGLTDPKVKILTGVDNVEAFNNYLIEVQ